MNNQTTVDRRKVYLGESEIHLLGKKPRIGESLQTDFVIAPARNAKVNLTREILSRGVSIVSTLPNIHTNACHYQVLDLEKYARKILPDAKIFHISSDAKSYWQEVDEVHPDLKASGFSLHESSSKDRDTFARTFGVGVERNKRIAHGLFGLVDGIFCAVYIPIQQLGNPDIYFFFQKFLKNRDHLKYSLSREVK